MRNPALKLALGEFRDHKGVYLAIIIVVSLSMSVFITQSSLNEYNDYVTTKTIKTMYGDGVVMREGMPLRYAISGALPMSDARQTAESINAMPGFKAVMRAECEGGAVHKELEAHSRAAGESDGGTYWGIDVKNDETVCSLKDKIVDGEYFNTSRTYTQEAMGAPGGLALMRTPSAFYGDYSAGWLKYDSGQVKAYPVLVGRACASLHNLKIGEVFIGTWLTTQGALYNDVYLEIIGIYETGKPLFEVLNYIVPIESIQEVQGWDSNTSNYVCVKAPPGIGEDGTKAKVLGTVGEGKVFFSSSELKTIWEGNLEAMGRFILYITIAASLLLAVAAVKYVMDSIVIRKNREIGTLKALGARDRMVVSIFLYQALLIGLFSAGLGLLSSLIIMQALSHYGLSVPSVMGSRMEIKFILSPMTAVLAFAIPMVVTVAAAVVPCIHVARMSPIEAIRQGEAQGARLTGRRLPRLSSILKRRINAMTLAFDEISDHKVIYGTIVLVVAVALAVFMMQSAYKENMVQNITGSVRGILSSDGMILAPGSNQRSMFGGAPQIVDAVGLAQEIEEKTGYRAIARSSNQNIVQYTTESGETVLDGGLFWGIDVKEDEDVFDVRSKIIDGDYFDPDKDYSQNVIGEKAQNIPGFQVGGIGTTVIVQELETPYPVLIGETAAKAHNIQVGDVFTFMILNSKKGSGIVSCQFEAIGIFNSRMPLLDALVYFTPRVAINEMMGYGENDGNAIMVKAPGNPDYRQIYDTMHAAAPDMEAFSWHEAVLFFNGAAFDAITLIIYTAIAITLALVAISIKYAMDSTVDRKTREIGTLKALGARDRMIVQIFIYQGVFIGIFAGITAMLLSYAAIYASVNVFSIQSQLPLGVVMKVGFTITPTMVAITMLAPTIVSIFASYMPSRRAAKLSPVEALRKGDLNL